MNKELLYKSATPMKMNIAALFGQKKNYSFFVFILSITGKRFFHIVQFIIFLLSLLKPRASHKSNAHHFLLIATDFSPTAQ